jgi:hypothetical protein
MQDFGSGDGSSNLPGGIFEREAESGTLFHPLPFRRWLGEWPAGKSHLTSFSSAGKDGKYLGISS